ncbi:peptidase S24 [Pseudomonas sp. HAR-UPW-AIA-41]|uniref:LexA family protein n=1 Tax=Pseudomonas sp. HAR-UPW-AIA-41 TaxID=1985301 RepID=UPI000BB3991D|nr:S24 family peptidase [Pseudomonas sp. HAR-UPW-AIA-41]PAV48480.1 peptidase S24 [Pseudomonas sp. HAR-UPW-AIA-41]
MTIYEIRLANTRRQIKERQLMLKDLANLLGKSPAQVSAFAGESAHKNIGEQIAREIERALDLPRGYLDAPHDSHGNGTIVGTTGRKLPVIGSIAAGAWCEAVDQFNPGDAEEWVEAPGPVGANAFILRVEGISMEPLFTAGEKVVIDPSLEAQPGHYVVAKRLSDQGVTLKQLRQEGSEYYLYAVNPNWPERIIRLTEEWHICGRARWKIVDL